MCKFNVGDTVVCNRISSSLFPHRLGQVATILGIDRYERLKLSEPFNTESGYSPKYFDLYNTSLENK